MGAPRTFRCLLAALAVGLGCVPGAQASCLSVASHAEKLLGIPRNVLQSIVLTESGGRPFALNIDGQAVLPATHDEALAIIGREMPRADNIDIGCAQISMRYHGSVFRKQLASALDPVDNVAYAGLFLVQKFRETRSWELAVAHYHSAERGRHQEYLCAFSRHYARLNGRPLRPDEPCHRDGVRLKR